MGLVPHFDTVGPAVWVAAFAASITAGMVSGTTVVAAISLSEGRLQIDRLRTVLTMATVASVTNTSLALIAGTLLLRSPQTTILLGIPIGTVFLSYGAYLREREKHESLEFLYASTRILSETPELEHAVVSLVGQGAGDVPRRDRPDAVRRSVTTARCCVPGSPTTPSR